MLGILCELLMRIMVAWCILGSVHGQDYVYNWIVTEPLQQLQHVPLYEEPLMAIFPFDAGQIATPSPNFYHQFYYTAPMSQMQHLPEEAIKQVTVANIPEEIDFKSNFLDTFKDNIDPKLEAAKNLYEVFGKKSGNKQAGSIIPDLTTSTTTTIENMIVANQINNINSVPELPCEIRTFLTKLKKEQQRRRDYISYLPVNQPIRRLESLFEAINKNIKTDKHIINEDDDLIQQDSDTLESRTEDLSLEDNESDEKDKETNNLQKLSDKEIQELITFFDKFVEIYHKLSVETSTPANINETTTDGALEYMKDQLKVSSSKYGALAIIVSKRVIENNETSKKASSQESNSTNIWEPFNKDVENGIDLKNLIEYATSVVPSHLFERGDNIEPAFGTSVMTTESTLIDIEASTDSLYNYHLQTTTTPTTQSELTIEDVTTNVIDTRESTTANANSAKGIIESTVPSTDVIMNHDNDESEVPILLYQNTTAKFPEEQISDFIITTVVPSEQENYVTLTYDDTTDKTRVSSINLSNKVIEGRITNTMGNNLAIEIPSTTSTGTSEPLLENFTTKAVSANEDIDEITDVDYPIHTHSNEIKMYETMTTGMDRVESTTNTIYLQEENNIIIANETSTDSVMPKEEIAQSGDFKSILHLNNPEGEDVDKIISRIYKIRDMADTALDGIMF